MNKTNDNVKVPIQQRLGGIGAALILRQSQKLLDRRIVYYDYSTDPYSPLHNQHCIYAFWHEYLTIPVAHWVNCPITMLVSQHRDAEWLTQAGLRLRLNVVRGSTQRGGTQAIRELKRACQNSGLGITPDGPKGPRRKMAMGPVFLASILGMPIVPVGLGYDRPWRLGTWDRFAIPKPLSRARVIFGPKIEIPRRLNATKRESYRGQIERLINELTKLAENWAQTGHRFKDERALERRHTAVDQPESTILQPRQRNAA